MKYNKKTGLLILKNNVKAEDEKNNIIYSDYAEYNEKEEIFKSIGFSKIITSENYIIQADDIIVDNKKKF